MYRAFYEHLSFAWLPQATAIFFCTFFVAVLLRLFVFNRGKDFEQVAALPLEEDKS